MTENKNPGAYLAVSTLGLSFDVWLAGSNSDAMYRVGSMTPDGSEMNIEALGAALDEALSAVHRQLYGTGGKVETEQTGQ